LLVVESGVSLSNFWVESVYLVWSWISLGVIDNTTLFSLNFIGTSKSGNWFSKNESVVR
jgi:hypothetical protein